ncbi:MAG: hypothetical protein KDB71_13300 [Mycobacterium sp.]|nr:hypothetical protein [Mycobacterium sp.]
MSRQDFRSRMAERRSRLMMSRNMTVAQAVIARFKEIDGGTQGVLVSVQVFTVIIPLMILGYSYFTGFADNANAGTIWIRELGLVRPTSDTVRGAFGDPAGLQSKWTFIGLAAFLVWGVPMTVTVAGMFAKAWQREPLDLRQRLGRGVLWFVLYLTMIAVRERIAFGTEHHGVVQLGFYLLALIPVWVFWSLTPVILVRDGGHGFRYLTLAGLAGVVIDGIIIPVIGRVVFPTMIDSWTEFGPIGVAMALMTWCGLIGTGWVVTACVGAVLWERTAPTDTVLEAQTAT